MNNTQENPPSPKEEKVNILNSDIPTPKPLMLKRQKMPTVFGVAVLLIGLVTGIVLVQREQNLGTEATDEGQPADVRVTNITDSSFTVNWTTQTETPEYVLWGKDNDLTSTGSDNITSNGTVHSANITGLSAQTTYSFKIGSGDKVFDNNGQPWEVTTGPVLQNSSVVSPISGTITLANGQPASNAIVYINIGGASPVSTITTSNGNWILPLTTIRSRDLNSYLSIDDQNTVMEIFVQAGRHGIATATSYPWTSRPLPTLSLGSNEDFRNSSNTDSSTPSSEINLPEETNTNSRFNLESTNSNEDNTVTLESIDEGEVFSTTQPQFFGEGSPGTTLTITVESTPMTDNISVGTNGTWNWSLPNQLEEGSHKVIISWRDGSGILRTITRSFTVEVSGSTALLAATPTPTIKPTSTPKPTPTLTSTPKPTPDVLASSSPLPDAGISVYTLNLALTGLVLLLMSSFAIVVIRNKK